MDIHKRPICDVWSTVTVQFTVLQFIVVLSFHQLVEKQHLLCITIFYCRSNCLVAYLV